jgi:hypothetical protein
MRGECVGLDGRAATLVREPISSVIVVASAAVLFASVYAALIVFFALPSEGGLLPGSRSYGLLAGDVVSGGSFSSTYRPPLYPLFLAAVMLIHSDWSAIAVWLQGGVAVALGMSVVWATLRVSKSILAGSIAAGIYSTHLLLHLEMLSERETLLFAALTLGFVWMWIFGRRTNAHILVMAVITALLYLTRPTGVVFVLALCALLMIERGAEPLVSTIRRMMLCVGVIIVLVLPWQVFVSQKAGELRFSASTTSGINLLKGNNRDLERFFPMVDVDLYEPFISETVAQHGLSGPKEDERLKDIATAYILSDPGRSVARAVAKGLLLFSPVPLPLGKGELRRVNGEIELYDFEWRSLIVVVIATVHALIMFGGIVACFRSDHGFLARRLIVGVLLVSGLFTMAHAVTFPETRFRLPLDVLLTVLAAMGYAGLFQVRRDALIGTRGMRARAGEHQATQLAGLGDILS